ncbi:MAG TPA: gliding motility-associated C-terminal domain-containing protein [Flavipsychrobacter sp.]|nr:gliding motility-associated C-terminal domain-containing protein [Flavipsychrobacter sp.]
MKQANHIRFIAISSVFMLLCVTQLQAQMDSCNVFLQGKHIEVGINTNGAYGSSVDAPPGFHPKGPDPVWDACYPTVCPTLGLGFVADPDKDGWTVGSPPYFGDYFLPGTPQEGWSIEINGVQGNAWNGSGSCGSTSGYPFSITNLTGQNISYNSTGRRVSGVWQGKMDSLQITQLTTLDTGTVYFTIYITLKNTSSVTKKSVFYLRTLDPDNDEPEPGGGFTTDNKIAYQLPNAKNRTLVTATGLSSPKAYLGLGTLDCRAKCFICSTTGLEPTAKDLDSMYEDNGGIGDTSDYLYSGEQTQDEGIGLVFKLGDIPPGDSVSFAYAYVLRAADLDSAFESTKPKWQDGTDTSAHISGDTALTCKNSVATISIVNGAYFNWFWFPSTDLDTNQGTTVKITMGTTPKTLMAIGSTPSCASDTLIINLVPNLSPPPGVTDTIFYCQNAVATPLTATGQNLRWYYSNSPTDTGTTTSIIPRTDSMYNFTYYVTQTVRGCLSDKSAITVIIHPPLPALDISNNGPLCLGDTLLLTAPYSAGATYAWTGPNGFSSNDQNASRTNVVEADTGAYSLVATVNGCPSKASKTELYIDEVVAGIGVDTDKVCNSNPLHVRFTGIAPDTGVTSYTWSFQDATVNSGSGAGPYVITFDTSLGVRAITLTVKNWRCSSTITKDINVGYAPPITYNIKKDICVNDSTALQVATFSLQNALNLNWNYAGAIVGQGSQMGNYTVSWSTPGDKIISLSIAYPQCVSAPDSDTIHVHALPPAQILSVSKNDICVGDSVVFTAPTGQYTYTWNPAVYFPNYSKISNTAYAKIQATGNVFLTLTDQYGCQATDSMFMNTQACCIISLPTAFTPNGDGKNDVFLPITIGHHQLKVFRVVNRWGQTVFESNNEKLGWDGKFNGVPQDMDTYFWYLSFQCDNKTVEEEGEVVLIR